MIDELEDVVEEVHNRGDQPADVLEGEGEKQEKSTETATTGAEMCVVDPCTLSMIMIGPFVMLVERWYQLKVVRQVLNLRK